MIERLREGFRPGMKWRLLRRFAQAFALVAIVVAPFLGGWQRLERIDLSSWQSPGAELPAALQGALPRGDAAGEAHENNRLLGGGLAVDYLGVPTVDPLAGTLALIARPSTGRALVAVAIPVLIALVVGRVFCGWFCPFGTLSRALAWLLGFFPFVPKLRIPRRRPLRFAVLGVGALAGLLGVHVVLYAAMPHLLVQHSVYSAWLLGGGGAALGLLVGLLLVGLVFGPTTYCATLCPTGGALRVLGSKKVVHLKIAQPRDCGKSCRRCAQSCWLQLDPASGDPGPDCDLCGRCVPQCPKTNLRIGIGKGELKAGAVLVALLAAAPAAAHAQGRAGVQPRLSLAAERVVDGVTIAVDVVDQTGVRPYPDAPGALRGSDVSVFVARGERGAADERGLLPERETYQGPLTVRIGHSGGEEVLRFDAPTAPRSTPRRSIYRRRVDLQLEPGDTVEVAAVGDWLASDQRFEVPPGGVDSSPVTMLLALLAGLCLFGGPLAIALVVPDG